MVRMMEMKTCYDVMLSSQDESRSRHLASGVHVTDPACGDTKRLFLLFGGTGLQLLGNYGINL